MIRSTITAAAITATTALLLGAGCVADFEEEISESYQFIVNGELNAGDPAVGLINLGGGLCTGTMVTSKVMVTARHCVVDQNGVATPPGNMAVFWGSKPGPDDSNVKVLSHEYHPTADIAVLELAEAAPVAPIPMNTRDLVPFIGQAVRVSGYGVTAQNNRDSGTKRQGTTELFQLVNEPGFGEIMYIGNVGSKTCFGDSGGPAFMTFDGVEYLVGVTSYGTGVCEAPDTIDGQVRIDRYQDFITQFVTQKDPGGLPVAGAPNAGGGTVVTGPQGRSTDLVGGCSVTGDPGAGSLATLLFLALFLAVRRRQS